MQDRYRQIDEILLRRTAGPYIGSFSTDSGSTRDVRYSPIRDNNNGHQPPTHLII